MSSDLKKEINEANVLSDEEMEDVGGGYDGAVIAEDAVYRGSSPLISNALLQDDDEPSFIKTPFNGTADSGGFLKRHFKSLVNCLLKKPSEMPIWSLQLTRNSLNLHIPLVLMKTQQY